MKTVFKNKTFYQLLIICILLLIIWNIYAGVKSENIFAIVPIAIECALLTLTLTHNQHAKISIMIWTVIFMIIVPGLDVIAYIMDGANNVIDSANNGIEGIITYKLAFDVVNLIIGILIVDFTRRTVLVQRDNDVTE